MSYVFDLQDIPTLPVAGIADVFPVHRIYCVGQNYFQHAREMGINADRVSPFFLTNQQIQPFQESRKCITL